jgi:hypothetical protein
MDFFDVGYDDGYNDEPKNWRLLDTLSGFEQDAYHAGYFQGEADADAAWTL